MKKYNIKKQLYKYLVFALAILSFLGLVNVRAGYTYDSKGEPIYSTEGFTVNELPLKVIPGPFLILIVAMFINSFQVSS